MSATLSTIAEFVVRVAFWMALAPLGPGIINKVKAWVAGRKGPPVLQLYYDLARLWRKGVVISTAASPGHIIGPAIAWIAISCAAALLPIGPFGSTVSFRGDAFLFIYLLAVARFAIACASLETGSAFEGMGTAREVSYAVLAEAALITALITLSVRTGSLSLSGMLTPFAGSGVMLIGAGLFMVLLAENCRVPFDDPNTHLELTMVHEAMVLDHSGPPFAAILHGSAIKLLLFAVLLADAVLPGLHLGGLGGMAVTVLALGIIMVGVGAVESLLARFAFRRVPLLLITAFLLCLFGLLAAWKGSSLQ